MQLNSSPITDELRNWCHQRSADSPSKNTSHSREVPWQEPALQAATNQHHQTEGTSLEKLTWPNIYHDPLPMRGRKGWALNWQSRQPKQWSTKLNWASKLHIIYGDQSSDPSKVVIYKDQHSTAQLQVWQLELTGHHCVSQALATTPQIIENTEHNNASGLNLIA